MRRRLALAFDGFTAVDRVNTEELGRLQAEARDVQRDCKNLVRRTEHSSGTCFRPARSVARCVADIRHPSPSSSESDDALPEAIAQGVAEAGPTCV